MTDLPPHRTAGEVLADIQKLHAAPSRSEMETLVRLAEALAGYDPKLMSPADRARWAVRKESKQEKRVLALAERIGFRQGAKIASVLLLLLGAFT